MTDGAQELETLSCDLALSVIEPFFEAIREVFLEHGVDRLETTRLYCAPWVHDSPRHFAGCRDDGKVIVVAPEMADLPADTVRAILAHELGHAVDFLYPAQWALGPDRTVRARDVDGADDVQRQRWVRGWSSRDHDAVEFTADAIAELLYGVPIGYCGPCTLQCFNRGQARPSGLR